MSFTVNFKIATRLFVCLSAFIIAGIGSVLGRPGMPQLTDTSDKIWRGEKLRKLSPVCYYYNSLMQSLPSHKIANQRLPGVVYAPGWEKFVVDEDRYGKKVVFSPTDSNLDDDDKYNDFINQYDLKVESGKDVLEITSVATGMFVSHVVIQSRLFFDGSKNPLIGVSSFYSGLYVTPVESSFKFYLLKNNAWIDVTNKVITLPEVNQYFSMPVDVKLVRQYSLAGVHLKFTAGSNNIIVEPFDASNLNCDENDKITGVKIDKDLKKKLCDMVHSLKSVYFAYDKKSFKFKKLNK